MANFQPKAIDDFVYSKPSTKSLIEEILTQHLDFPSNGKNSLMLYGIGGSGKTTFANFFFKQYEAMFDGDTPLVESIDVDGDKDIFITLKHLNKLSSQVGFFNFSNKWYFLFDEFDGYTERQQRRLKSWLNSETIVCIMTTNYIDKIDKGILRRCHIINFNASNNTSDYVERIQTMIANNNLTPLDTQTLIGIADRGKGDWTKMCVEVVRHCNRQMSSPTKPTTPKLRVV